MADQENEQHRIQRNGSWWAASTEKGLGDERNLTAFARTLFGISSQPGNLYQQAPVLSHEDRSPKNKTNWSSIFQLVTKKEMTLESLKAKEELRELIDAYAYLGDEKKLAEQMKLFTPDAVYTVYMNGALIATTAGTTKLAAEFDGHAAQVKTYFTLNGQHTVKLDGDTATGISFSQLKMIRESEGKDILTDYSVKYEDSYVRRNGKWLINERTGHFLIIATRPLT